MGVMNADKVVGPWKHNCWCKGYGPRSHQAPECIAMWMLRFVRMMAGTVRAQTRGWSCQCLKSRVLTFLHWTWEFWRMKEKQWVAGYEKNQLPLWLQKRDSVLKRKSRDIQEKWRDWKCQKAWELQIADWGFRGQTGRVSVGWEMGYNNNGWHILKALCSSLYVYLLISTLEALQKICGRMTWG